MTTAASVARHARVKELFLDACERPPEERPAYLADAGGSDSELCREVESLLARHRESATAADPATACSRPPEIAGYRLVQKLGEGGMGEVWEAEQERPVRRRVALKVIKWGMDTREVLARFESERQALALMDHPAVARVFEAGATAEGRPWFAMELVRGVPITEYCDTQRLTTGERLRLLLPVCDGVQHAHHKGIIHRDLKPLNVLVAVRDGRAVPKIIDFGVAKATAQRLTERTVFTELGQWIGTPEYMSPEQAEMTGLDVDTRTDVYSLGVVLYELLTGAQPFDSEELRRSGFDEMRRRIREEEPPRPSTRVSTLGERASQVAARRRGEGPALVRELRGDLDWITMKALEKDRTRRYGSPAELAADLQRHLGDQPVTAGPPAALYRAGKFARRHRLAVVAAAAVALALVLGLALALFGLGRARQAERLARREAAAARQVSEVLVGIFEDIDPGGLEGGVVTPERMLSRGVERVEKELADQPLVQARLLATLGSAYRHLGFSDRARSLLEKALKVQRQRLGEDHPEVGATLSVLATLLPMQGDPEGGRAHLERALAIQEKALGPDHPQVAITLARLATTLWGDAGDPARVRRLFERALAIQERALGSDHPDLGATLYLQSVMLTESGGDLEQARRLGERAVAIFEKAFGPEHADLATALWGLGAAHRAAGDRQTASRLWQRSLAIREKVLGPDNLVVAQTLAGFAWAELEDGDFAAARQHAERCLEIHRQALGEGHPLVAESLALLATIRSRTGDLPRAREELARARATLERTWGPAHPETLSTLYNQACLAALDGARADALELLRELVDRGWANAWFFEDPDLDSLRGDPELEVLAVEMRRMLDERGR